MRASTRWLTLFLGMTLRNHPTIPKESFELIFDDDGDVEPGPPNFTIGVGAEFQLHKRVRFMVHAYYDNAVSRAIDFGAKSVEHGHLMTEAAVRKMAEQGVYLVVEALMSMSEGSRAVLGSTTTTLMVWWCSVLVSR